MVEMFKAFFFALLGFALVFVHAQDQSGMILSQSFKL